MREEMMWYYFVFVEYLGCCVFIVRLDNGWVIVIGYKIFVVLLFNML